MKRTVLLDADVTLYKHLYRNFKSIDWDDDGDYRQTFDLEAAKMEMRDSIAEIMDTLKADDIILALSDRDRDNNWRRHIMPTYKEHRSSRPEELWMLHEFLKNEYKCYERPHLEGDDVLGILATAPDIVTGEKIVYSIDKDMRTIPTREHPTGYNLLYNPDRSRAPEVISEPLADTYWMMQTLMGDRVDGYKGVPRVGQKRAAKLINATPYYTVEYMWPIVLDAYLSAGLTEADAIANARVARIARDEDYDRKHRRMRLWMPPT